MIKGPEYKHHRTADNNISDSITHTADTALSVLYYTADTPLSVLYYTADTVYPIVY